MRSYAQLCAGHTQIFKFKTKEWGQRAGKICIMTDYLVGVCTTPRRLWTHPSIHQPNNSSHLQSSLRKIELLGAE